MSERPVVIVSNRGPVSFSVDDDGSLQATRGAGGMVSGLAPLVAGTDATWIAAAISDGDRLAAARGVIEADGFRVRTLAIDADDYALAYDVVCNATLWFVHHGLYDLTRTPVFDRAWREAWSAYRRVNDEFAAVVAEEAAAHAVVLVQDYHLLLLADRLRDLRPDLTLVHFSHTPFADPDQFRVLPDDVAGELLRGMAAHHACGFHTRRWADSFVRCCKELAGLDPVVFVAPLAPDAGDITRVAGSAASRDALASLDHELGERCFLVRVDRIELSKNLLRGFWAFDDLLQRYPHWRSRVVFGAFCYPSRGAVPEYVRYQHEVRAAVTEINDRWGTADWRPIMFDDTDDFPRSVAALARADVLLVNPVRDGLNLVAKEGPIVSGRDLLVVLSTQAGVYDELVGSVRAVNPFDVAATADALDAALAAEGAERSEEAAELRARARARTPADWLDDQLRAAR